MGNLEVAAKLLIFNGKENYNFMGQINTNFNKVTIMKLPEIDSEDIIIDFDLFLNRHKLVVNARMKKKQILLDFFFLSHSDSFS